MKPSSPPMHATLPYLGGADERRALLAGITFLDLTDARDLTVQELSDWFDQHVVANGSMPRLSVLLEPPAGTIALQASGPALARAQGDLPRIASAARARIVGALRGLISAPQDDRFLRAAIFLNRVRRQDGHWVARPEPTAPLSGIVLSLFAVAILSERSFYDHHLCVCDACGRVSFDPTPAMKRFCPTHAMRASGMQIKVPSPGSASG
ncbi:Hypothetical protein A7982_07133 [Minicystis rosea]|nr:Hypothetical protein A7982_07133 [Minicystis rosea]